MNRPDIPEFAIVGHPNEGKSSVVSTLSEDDSVRISPVPGETVKCRSFPVFIDGREVIRFIDTPGFQNPVRTLQWMTDHNSSDRFLLETFIRRHADQPDFDSDCELLGPIIQGAGIIYVVDGSRPLRNIDKAEMEILRLTGRPRMAIINCKEHETGYMEQWKSEFRMQFNAIRVFNAHKATYAERIALLESLKSIDQDWEPALQEVISAFKKDWAHRNDLTAEIICRMLIESMEFSISKTTRNKSREEKTRAVLQEAYNRAIEKIERNSHNRIRRLFKQNIFNCKLPMQSILHNNLFSRKTWQVLGLSPKQLITSAGLAGGAAGAVIDTALSGLSFGIFTTIGGVAGAGWAAYGGGKRLAETEVSGIRLGGYRITIGPQKNLQLTHILIDRALIFFAHIINWAHGRRDYPASSVNISSITHRFGYTAEWRNDEKRTSAAIFNAVRSGNEINKDRAGRDLKEVLKKTLRKISHNHRKE